MLASAYFLGFSYVSPPVLNVLGQHEALPHASYLNLALLTVSCIFVSYERREMLWWVGGINCSAQAGLLVSGAPLSQIRAPKVILSLFPPITALTCWNGYSQHAQKEWCVWFDFSHSLLSDAHLHCRIPICTSLAPIPLTGPLALQAYVKVYRISCCLMPSTAACF